jgi:hypothetical protein
MTVLAVGSQNQALEPPFKPTSATGLDAADDTEDVPLSPVHDDSTTTDVPANYVSDAELLAWLQAKSSDQYGELDELMGASNARSKLIKELSELKTALTKEGLDPNEALTQIEELQAAYEGTDQAKDIAEVLEPLRTIVESYAEWQAGLSHQPPAEGVPVEEVLDETNKAIADTMDSETESESESESEPAPAPAPYRWESGSFFEAQLAKSMGGLDATIKDLEHVDQLALIQIQALMSEVRETAQLTSNILANRSQTSDSIVGNLRA